MRVDETAKFFGGIQFCVCSMLTVDHPEQRGKLAEQTGVLFLRTDSSPMVRLLGVPAQRA